MSAHHDVAQLQRRLDTLTRAAAKLRAHAPDLYRLGWEPYVGERLEGDAPGFESSPPRTGDPRARKLFDRLASEAAQMAAELVGLERSMTGLFYAGSSNPEPSRGSTISREEFDRRLGRQRAQGDSPARLVDQPQHPGAQR